MAVFVRETTTFCSDILAWRVGTIHPATEGIHVLSTHTKSIRANNCIYVSIALAFFVLI